MKYQKALNIWTMDSLEARKKLQPGQWVRAGFTGPLGRFYGVKPSGVVVVAWLDNAKKSKNYFEYCRTLRDYAKSQ